MRDFGMTPVLPAFAGHIPKALVDKYPRCGIFGFVPSKREKNIQTETT